MKDSELSFWETDEAVLGLREFLSRVIQSNRGWQPTRGWD